MITETIYPIESVVYPLHHWKQGNIIMTNWCVQEITFYRIQRAHTAVQRYIGHLSKARFRRVLQKLTILG